MDKLVAYEFTVYVWAENADDAIKVINERVGYDEDLSEYGVGDYRIALGDGWWN